MVEIAQHRGICCRLHSQLMMRALPASVLALMTGHAFGGSNEFRPEHRWSCQRECRTRGFMRPSRHERDGDDGHDDYWQQPSEMPEPTTRLWQRPGRLCSRRGLSGSSGVCLLVPGLFLFTQRSTHENESRKPVIGSHRDVKYRDPTLSRASSGCHAASFYMRTSFVPQVTKGQLLYAVNDL